MTVATLDHLLHGSLLLEYAARITAYYIGPSQIYQGKGIECMSVQCQFDHLEIRILAWLRNTPVWCNLCEMIRAQCHIQRQATYEQVR